MKSKKLGIINKKSKKNGVKYNKKTNKLKKTSKLKRKKNLKRKLTLKKRGKNLKKIIKGGNPDEIEEDPNEIEKIVAKISKLFENDTNLYNFYNLDNFIRNLGINENKDNLFINNDSTSNKYINEIFKSEFKKKIKEKIKELNEKISNENNPIPVDDNRNEKIKGIYTGEVGLVFVLKDKTIKFSQNYDDAATYCNKLQGKTDNKERGEITLKFEGSEDEFKKKDISFPDIFNILDNIFKYSDEIKIIEGIKEESKQFVKIFPYSTMREQTPNDNVKEKITKMVEYRKQQIKKSLRFNISILLNFITNKIYQGLQKKLPYDSIIRHSRKIDTTTDLFKNYDILCCLADILLTLKQYNHYITNKKKVIKGGNFFEETLRGWMCNRFLDIKKTQDDMGTKYFPIIDRVDKDYNEYSEGNIVQDCGFNEIIIQRILKKFYDKEIEPKKGNKSYKIIDFKAFKLLFKEADVEYKKKKLQEIAKAEKGEEKGEKKEHPIGIKGNLISMESCEFKVKFNTEPPENLNNLSKLVRYCLLEINDYQKGKQFIIKLIEKLGLKNFQFDLFNNLLQNSILLLENTDQINNKIKLIKQKDNYNLEDIEEKIYGLIESEKKNKNLIPKEIEKALDINNKILKKFQKEIQIIIDSIYKKYELKKNIKKTKIFDLEIEEDSYFGLLKKLNKNVGFIHGDHKCANIFITKKNEIPYNSGERESDCEFNINDIENYGIFDKICFVVADLDKSRCQIKKKPQDKTVNENRFEGFNPVNNIFFENLFEEYDV